MSDKDREIGNFVRILGAGLDPTIFFATNDQPGLIVKHIAVRVEIKKAVQSHSTPCPRKCTSSQ